MSPFAHLSSSPSPPSNNAIAKHGRRLLNLLDDTPLVPGDTRPIYDGEPAGRQVLTDAEMDLREWTPRLEPVPSSADGMTRNLMPAESSTATQSGGEVGQQQQQHVGEVAGGGGGYGGVEGHHALGGITGMSDTTASQEVGEDSPAVAEARRSAA